MNNRSLDTEKFFKSACYFEGSLIIVAMIIGWIADIDPFADLNFSEAALANGLLITLPLLVLFFTMQQLSYPPLLKIRSLLQATLGPRLYRRHWTDLLILAGIAGISEELLFRGVLQPWLENTWNLIAGLIASNLIFALVHAITPLYALLAMSIGIYLGLSLDYGGERNLLIPIIIHTLYDFVAFVAILRDYRNQY